MSFPEDDMDDVCGDWQHPVEEITGMEPGRPAGYRCDLDPGHGGQHGATVAGVVAATWGAS